MCLIVFAYRVHPEYPVVIAANRDEFYNRPTAVMGEWSDAPNILAGRDLKGGGTWMGIGRNGRMAALTNFREPDLQRTGAPTRGHLVSDFLKGRDSLNQYINKLSSTYKNYNGYSILLSENGQWVYYSNRSDGPQELTPGIHGLSNHFLNTPWPKVERSRRAMESLLTSDRPPDMKALLSIMQDRSIPPDEALPRTGVELAWERRLGAVFIHSAIYGTRSSTILVVARDGTTRICERSFDGQGQIGEVAFDLTLPFHPMKASRAVH